jgi:hypothetical protein
MPVILDAPPDVGAVVIGCRDQCGRKQPHEDAAMQAGWSYLHITGGWRCGACDSTLRGAARIVGRQERGSDPLPPDSLGALKHKTASSITPPVVKP